MAAAGRSAAKDRQFYLISSNHPNQTVLHVNQTKICFAF